MENEDKRIEELVDKLMANDSLEKAPVNFTNDVMSKIELLSETKTIVYKPLIPKYVWWLLGLGFVALIVNVILNKSSDSSSLSERYNLPEVSFDVFNNLSVDFSSTLMYATVLLAIMVAIQVPLLKQYFNQKLSY
ncbi:MAG: hypothetical protein CMC05_12880 [Flavobacteriaceae bacterium]|nr:hypothetical protein [Flavobacteriaceae bacterium]MBD10488.1 hypothetical protein [Flavobacteriaceae bacterium]|tara:strand:+ start:166 stop:570 length:405 start_codon:yes stop_codon:yes gene_type:complete